LFRGVIDQDGVSYGNGSGGGLFQAGEAGQGGGLSAAGGAQEGEELPVLDGEADLVENGVASEVFAEILDYDVRHLFSLS
jgi:uncharacterized spore protein YtfJ